MHFHSLHQPVGSRLTTANYGPCPEASIMNNAINFNRRRWDTFAFALLDCLEEQSELLDIKIKKCGSKILLENGSIDGGARKAVFLKGGAAYFAYNDFLRGSLVNDAPRTHDYDFTICVESLSSVDDIKLREFFWTQIRNLEYILDLDKSGFVKIDTNRTQVFDDPREEICEGGSSEYLALTTLSDAYLKFTNYRINVFLPTHQNNAQIEVYGGATRNESHHIVEFIFTSADIDYQHVQHINIFHPRPSLFSTNYALPYNIRVLDIISLMRYSIYAMVVRGLHPTKWLKARQDYARIIKFIPIVKSSLSLRSLLDSVAWKVTLDAFFKLSAHFSHCTAPVRPEMKYQDFNLFDRRLCDDVLQQIGFANEAYLYNKYQNPMQAQPFNEINDDVSNRSDVGHANLVRESDECKPFDILPLVSSEASVNFKNNIDGNDNNNNGDGHVFEMDNADVSKSHNDQADRNYCYYGYENFQSGVDQRSGYNGDYFDEAQGHIHIRYCEEEDEVEMGRESR